MDLSAIRRGMEEAGLDALILTSSASQRYVSRFNFTDGYVAVGRRTAAVLADFRYFEAAKSAVTADFEVRLLERAEPPVLADTLTGMGARRVGYEDNTVTCAELERMKRKLPEFTLVPMGSLIDDLREFKTAEEIELIIRAQRIAEGAFRHVLPLISENMTENELAAELEYFMRRNGSDAPAFPTIAISGASTSLPHGEPRDKKLLRGFITMDYGAEVEGYRSDMTRTVSLGLADAEMKRLYRTVLDAQLAGIDAVREGADCGETDKVARDIIEGAGYHRCFGHSLGHGVGMYIHEAPNLSPSAFGRTLKRGHVVTVEPGIYLEGRYGCRIEDMMALTENGPLDLTDCEKELIEL